MLKRKLNSWKKELKNILIINGCLFMVALSITVFFVPAKIGSGGIMTFALSISHYLNIPSLLNILSSPTTYGNWSITGAAIIPVAKFLNGNDSVSTSFLFLLMNIPLLLYSLILFGKDYFFKTIYGTVALPVFMTIIGKCMDYLAIQAPEVHPIIAVIFGSAMLGVGIGLILGKGGSTGGTDIVGAIMNHYMKRLPIGTAIAIANFLILLFYFHVFGATKAVASIATTFLIGATIDLVLLIVFKIKPVKKERKFKFSRIIKSRKK